MISIYEIQNKHFIARSDKETHEIFKQVYHILEFKLTINENKYKILDTELQEIQMLYENTNTQLSELARQARNDLQQYI